MLQRWNSDMVRFMCDAAEYGNYYQALAELLLPELDGQTHICDAGCGLGFLSLALAPHVGQVTAVERDPIALAALEENCRRRGIVNITPRCGALQHTLPSQPYDAMVFCFFGGIDEILAAAKAQCCGKIFIITRNYTTHRFSVGRHPTGSYGYGSARQRLTELAIPFREACFTLENGQPLRTLADARRFYEIYSQDSDKSVISDEFLQSRLTQTGRADFPLYLPQQRELALLRFDTADIPDNRT